MATTSTTSEYKKRQFLDSLKSNGYSLGPQKSTRNLLANQTPQQQEQLSNMYQAGIDYAEQYKALSNEKGGKRKYKRRMTKRKVRKGIKKRYGKTRRN